MKLLDNFIAYMNKYSYGQIGNYVARKYLLTGKVEVYNEGEWLKATPQAAKEFIDAAPAEEPGPPPPLSDTPRAKKRNAVNAGALEEEQQPPEPSDEPPPKIDINAVRARAEAEQQRIMEAARAGTLPPPQKPGKAVKGKKGKTKPAPAPEPEAPPYAGDPLFFLQQMQELSDRLDQVQFSSASGYQDLRTIRADMKECIAAFRGDEPAPFEEV